VRIKAVQLHGHHIVMFFPAVLTCFFLYLFI